ncbi:MAG: YbaB/EbfC family nucleoid-associated protein [bacterium]
MSNLNNLLKQAQQMQAEMKKIQEQLAQQEFQGESGGGMVKAIVNGKLEPISIKFEPDIVNPEELDMLEDLIIAAFTAAQTKAQQEIKDKMSDLTGGMFNPMNLGSLFS